MKNVIKVLFISIMSLATVNAYAAPIEFAAGGVLDLGGASGLDTASSFTLSNVSGTSLNVFGLTGTGVLAADLPPAFAPVSGFLSINGWNLDLSTINDATITASFIEGTGSLFDGDHLHAATWSISAEVPSNSSLVVNTVVPVPAAVWLFGSGLIGLVGVARRKS